MNAHDYENQPCLNCAHPRRSHNRNRGCCNAATSGSRLCRCKRFRKTRRKGEWPVAPRAELVAEDLTDEEFVARYGYTKDDAAEMAYVGKLCDGAESDEEVKEIIERFAG